MSDDKKPKVVLLGATLDTGNLGVSALTAGAIRCIFEQYPEAEVSLLDYAEAPSVRNLIVRGQPVSVSVVNIRFSKRFYLPNNIAMLLLLAAVLKVFPFKRLKNAVLSRNTWLRHLTETSIAASVAGGDSFSDIYGLERLLYVSLPQVLVLLLGKELVLLPQTLGPFNRSLSKSIARFILKRAQRIYCRDRRGLRILQMLIGPTRADEKFVFCYDLGFAVDPVLPARAEVVGISLERENQFPIAGFNISGLLFMGGYTRKNMFGLRVNYKELTYEVIDVLVRQKGAAVLLVPHVLGSGSESDVDVCEGLYEELKDRYAGRLGVVRGSFNQSEIKYMIGRCDFFVGSRMHACIAAISQEIPTVSVAYSEKFIGVMETVGIEAVVADARSLTREQIVELVAKTYDRRDLIGKELKRRIPDVKTSVLNLFAGMFSSSHALDSGALDKAAHVASGV